MVTKVRSDTVIFSKLHGELPVLNHIPVRRGRGLKVTKPCGTFECSLFDLILIHRASDNPKAHMQGIDIETFAEAPCGRWMHRCNSRFLFHMRIAKYQQSIPRPREIKIFLHSHWTLKARYFPRRRLASADPPEINGNSDFSGR